MPAFEPVPDLSPDGLAAEFHVGTRNQAAYKRFYKAHDVHYDPAIRDLVTDAPLHVDASRVALPTEDVRAEMSVLDAIRRRASGRAFSTAPLPAGALATVLRHANGVLSTLQTGEGAFYRRAAANSGDLGSVEIFPILTNVEGVAAGMYHFDSVRHDLAEVRLGHFADWLRECVLYQTELSVAPAALVLTSAAGRLQAKYGPRGYRLALLDVGHVSQNIYLTATALGLQVCATAGFMDDLLDAALGLDGLDTAAMLVVLLGPS